MSKFTSAVFICVIGMSSDITGQHFRMCKRGTFVFFFRQLSSAPKYGAVQTRSYKDFGHKQVKTPRGVKIFYFIFASMFLGTMLDWK